MASEMRNGSILGQLLNRFELVQDFIWNEETVTKSELLDQSMVVSNAACTWLHAMDTIDLNIFMGFANETSVVDYFLNHAYRDNVTVYAS